MVKSERTCSQWRRTKSPSPHWLTPPRSSAAARRPFQEARPPNSVEIVSSPVDRRRRVVGSFCVVFARCVFSLPRGRVTSKTSCTPESCAGTETHGRRGDFGAAGEESGPERTRRTPIQPRDRAAPQIQMHPGHSICAPLPSSPGPGSTAALARLPTMMAAPHRSGQIQWSPAELKCVGAASKPRLASGRRRWRENGAAATCTHPDHSEQSVASVCTASPRPPPPHGSGASFTQKKDGGEEERKQEGETSKAFAFAHHSRLPNSFYYHNDYSIHVFNQKNMLMFCLFLFFLVKKIMGVEVEVGWGRMKYWSKNNLALLKHGEQDISQTT